MGDPTQYNQGPIAPPYPNCPNVDMACASAPCCYELSWSLLYLQPGAGNLEYATLVSSATPPVAPLGKSLAEPRRESGVRRGAAVSSARVATTAKLTWTHLETSTHDSVTADPLQFVGPVV